MIRTDSSYPFCKSCMRTCEENFYTVIKRFFSVNSVHRHTTVNLCLPPPSGKEKIRESVCVLALIFFPGRADVSELLICSKADIYCLQVTTPETTEFSSIITRICVLLHFAGKQHLYSFTIIVCTLPSDHARTCNACIACRSSSALFTKPQFKLLTVKLRPNPFSKKKIILKPFV